MHISLKQLLWFVAVLGVGCLIVPQPSMLQVAVCTRWESGQAISWKEPAEPLTIEVVLRIAVLLAILFLPALLSYLRLGRKFMQTRLHL